MKKTSFEKLNLKNISIEKSAMSNIQGGTTTTVMVEFPGCGEMRAELEYPDDGTGCPDWDVEPILVE